MYVIKLCSKRCLKIIIFLLWAFISVALIIITIIFTVLLFRFFKFYIRYNIENFGDKTCENIVTFYINLLGLISYSERIIRIRAYTLDIIISAVSQHNSTRIR